MKKITLITLTILLYTISYGQTVSELFQKRDYYRLAKLEVKTDSLSPEEIYIVGFAFFQLENDVKAIELYDKAIAKGLNTGTVYFYKGLSLRFLKKYDEALIEIDKSLKLEPTNQEFMNEKGLVYYYQQKYDIALKIFEEAKKLPPTFPEPFYWIAVIYHEQKDFNKALSSYYDALNHLPKTNTYYTKVLTSIGVLEYTVTKDYIKSAKAYAEAIELDKNNYELYSKLMKSYNAAQQYAKADSIFDILKDKYDKGKLPKEDMEVKTFAIAQFEWNGQIATVYRSFVEPKNMLDISYKVFVLNKEGDKIERRFVVEKTIQLEDDGAKHLLCEQDKKNGRHITYTYGWTTDKIPLEDLIRVVKLVLEGKIKAGASSDTGK